MNQIYTLEEVMRTGDALKGTAGFVFELHTPHTSQNSAMFTAEMLAEKELKEDLARCQQLYPEESMTEDDYSIVKDTLNDIALTVTLNRRSGYRVIQLKKFVVRKRDVWQAV